MPIIDIVILGLFIPGIIKGLKDGLIKQLTGALSLFVGAYLAYLFADFVGEHISSWINASETTITVISYALIIIGVIILASIISRALTKLINFVMLGWLNRLLGVLISVFATFLIIGLLLNFCLFFNDSFFVIIPSEQFTTSNLVGPIVDTTNEVLPFLKSIFGLD